VHVQINACGSMELWASYNLKIDQVWKKKWNKGNRGRRKGQTNGQGLRLRKKDERRMST